MSKLNINDLLATLKKPQQNVEQHLPKFAQDVLKDKSKKINVLSKKKQEMMRRQSNYEMAKQDMDKWIGVVKMNREKQSLNFQQKDLANLNVNFFPSQPMNDFQRKLEDKLSKMNVKSQTEVLRHEQAVLEKVDPQEAKRRLIEARKHRTTVFYEEQKRRRIAKIKSKLYRKIKKRQRTREEDKKIDQMTPAEKNEYIENLTKRRIKQRITLRHTAKNRHIKNLLRFNRSEKNGIQETVNEINDLRHKQLERLDENMLEQMSEEYDDENFRQEAMKDLQAEIDAMENEERGNEQNENEIDAKLKDLRFIQIAKQKRIQKQKRDAYKILSKLHKGKELKEKDVNSDAENSQQEVSENESNASEESQQQGAFKASFGSKVQEEAHQNIHESKKKANKTVEDQLKNYLLSGQASSNLDSSLKNKKIIEGIDVKNLQNKYQPERVPIDLTSLIAQNKEIYEAMGNEAALQNIREFQEEKMAQIEEEVNRNQELNKKKNPKGWGSWAGPGIKQKKVDPQEELRKKLKLIEEIKKKRKDNTLAHVVINETRNKNLSEYFVRNLPRQYATPEQFDFMQSEPVGPEWSSLTQFKDNIKPKVQTKAGQVITPATLPKKVSTPAKSRD